MEIKKNTFCCYTMLLTMIVLMNIENLMLFIDYFDDYVIRHILPCILYLLYKYTYDV